MGNRSILADPANKEMQQKLNLKIKYRESFRPFAPSVLAEDASKYFNLEVESPYMLLTADIKNEHKKEIPADFYQQSMFNRLSVERSDFPSITHLDFSSRVQTVSTEDNPKFHLLLQQYKEHTGHGMLINTSFNVRGEPIVCTPRDAYHCFMSTEMDLLVIENFIYRKNEQISSNEKQQWKVNNVLD